MLSLNEQGHSFLLKHKSLLSKAADRLAIRELIEAYAHCADRRNLIGQMSLFTANARFAVHMNATDPTPAVDSYSREALAPVFADLKQYQAITHFVGPNTLFTLTDDTGMGEAYCLAYYVRLNDNAQRLIVSSFRYLDSYVKLDGEWLFAERRLYIDSQEERAL
jgi:hypothetical protein